MNYLSLLSVILCFTGNRIFAQQSTFLNNKDVAGVYLTVSDFKNNRLTLLTDFRHSNDKIKLNQYVKSPNILSIEQDSVKTYNKDSIFAVHLSDTENYRFVNRNPCLIADTLYLFIYTKTETKKEYRQNGPHRRTMEVPVTYYLFSVGEHKQLYLLTLENLKKIVPLKPELIDEVYNSLESAETLYVRNPATNCFVLNESILFYIEQQNKRN
jgi:hypothetical protein